MTVQMICWRCQHQWHGLPCVDDATCECESSLTVDTIVPEHSECDLEQ